MYRCQICDKVVPPGTRCHKQVTSTRQKEYPVRTRAFPGYVKKDGQAHRSNKTRDRLDDRGGSGWEIASEINCCPACLANIKRANEVETN